MATANRAGAEVLGALSDFHAAEQANDLDGILAAFTDEGASDGVLRRDKQALRRVFQGMIAARAFDEMTIDMDPCEVSLAGDSATAGPVVYHLRGWKLVKEYDLKREADGVWRIEGDRRAVTQGDRAIFEQRFPREELASFDDRCTIRYVRVFSAPIERVWKAVTTSQELNIWLLPVSRVEPRLGGRASFTWGGPARGGKPLEVTIFEPPRVVRYSHLEESMAGGYLQFELESVEGGTRFTFIDHFPPAYRQDQTGLAPDRKDAALPAGPDSPWRPGFVAGFHHNCYLLGKFLEQNWSEDRIREVSARQVDLANGKRIGSFSAPLDELANSGWVYLVEVYHDHIRDCCPPADVPETQNG